MIEKPVTIGKLMDLDEHPIAHLVQEASQYESTVYIKMENKKVNAKSIMGMMSLQLEKGISVTVVAEGDDEDKAVEGLNSFLCPK